MFQWNEASDVVIPNAFAYSLDSFTTEENRSRIVCISLVPSGP